MSNNEWVQEGTPRDASWSQEPDEYGTPVSPTEWDDYSTEQAVPVPRPRVPEPVKPSAETAPEPVETAPDPVETAPDPVETAPDATEEAGPRAVVDAGPETVSDAVVEPTREDDPAWGRDDASWVADERREPAAPAVADHGDADPADHVSSDEPVFFEESTPSEVPDDAAAHDGVAHDGVAHDADAADVDGPDADPAQVPHPDEPEVVAQAAAETDPEHLDREPEAEQTRVRPLVVSDPVIAGAAGGALAGSASGPGIAGLYRQDGDETQVIETPGRLTLEEEAAEEARLAEQLRAEKEARDQRLGLVATSPANAVRDSAPAPRRGVGAFGSVGLLVLRLVVAALLGIIAYQVLTQIDASADYLAQQSLIPEPRLVAWIVGFTLAGLAIFLIMGLAVRVVGLLMAAIGIAGLALLRWGAFSPFVAGQTGFVGDRDLLLVAIGILFFCIGGGKAGIDGALSAARAASREAKRS